MAVVNTNDIQIAFAETGASEWKNLQVTDITRFSNENTLTAPEIISRNRQNLRSKITSSTSGVGYSAYLGLDAVAAIQGPLFFAVVRNEHGIGIATAATNATTDAYTIAAATSDQAFVVNVDSLIWASGFNNAANNGLKTVDANLVANATSITVSESLVTESGANGRLDLAGHRIQSATTKSWTYSALTAQATLSLANANSIQGLYPGQFVVIGSIPSDGGEIQNAFDSSTGSNDIFGKARIRSITNTGIVFDTLSPTLRQSSSGTQTAIDIVFGTFTTNVPQGPLFGRTSLQYEMTLRNYSQASGNPDMYRYSDGNIVNSVVFNIPSEDYVTIGVETLGTFTHEAVLAADRRTGADAAVDPQLIDTFVTGKDIARITLDADTLGLGITAFDVTVTMSNNLTGRNAIAVDGVWRVLSGNFTTGVEMEVSLEDPALETAIEGTQDVAVTVCFENEDGVIILHVPAVTLSKTGETFTRNDVVTVSGSATAFQDPLFETSGSISILYVPFRRDQL